MSISLPYSSETWKCLRKNKTINCDPPSRRICNLGDWQFIVLMPKLSTMKQDVSVHFHACWAKVARITLEIEMNESGDISLP